MKKKKSVGGQGEAVQEETTKILAISTAPSIFDLRTFFIVGEINGFITLEMTRSYF